MSNFGKQIKYLREKLNLTQKDISDALEVSQSYYSKLENQEHEPTSDVIVKASDYLNVSTDWLLKNEESKKISDNNSSHSINTDSVGERISILRNNANLSLSKLAELTNLKKSSLSSYENGKYEPSVESIIVLSTFFGVSADWLLTGKENTRMTNDTQCKQQTVKPDLIKNYNLNPMIFSENLNYIIKKKKITQKELANNLGVSKTSLNNYCNGRIPDVTILFRLSQVLDVSMERLLTGKDTLKLTFPTDLTNDEIREVQSYVKYLIFKRDNNI